VSAAFAAFLFGILAGYTMLRLGRNKPVHGLEGRVLRPLGWIVMSASFVLALALFVHALAEIAGR
jgi:hypothetical protein